MIAAMRPCHRRGASVISYGLLLGLVSVGALAAVDSVGQQTLSLFDRTAADIAGGAPCEADSAGIEHRRLAHREQTIVSTVGGGAAPTGALTWRSDTPVRCDNGQASRLPAQVVPTSCDVAQDFHLQPGDPPRCRAGGPPVLQGYPPTGTVALEVDENQRTIATLTAIDPDGAPVSYALSGPDAALFSLDLAAVPGSAVLLFTAADGADYEAPANDANGDRVYALSLSLDDGSGPRLRSLSVALQPVNEPPVRTACGPDPFQLAPGASTVVDVSACFADPEGATPTLVTLSTIGVTLTAAGGAWGALTVTAGTTPGTARFEVAASDGVSTSASTVTVDGEVIAGSCLAYRDAASPTPASGVYTIDPDGDAPGGLAAFDVWCDMDTAGGGWTLDFAQALMTNGANPFTLATQALDSDATTHNSGGSYLIASRYGESANALRDAMNAREWLFKAEGYTVQYPVNAGFFVQQGTYLRQDNGTPLINGSEQTLYFFFLQPPLATSSAFNFGQTHQYGEIASFDGRSGQSNATPIGTVTNYSCGDSSRGNVCKARQTWLQAYYR